MDLILPYINPQKFAGALISNYGFSAQQAWNANLLVMPEATGSGSLQLFIRNNIHFFRGKWNFKEQTLFYSSDPVGKKGFIDFRISANGNIQSCAIEGRKKFEFDTTNIDGMRIFISESLLPASVNQIHSRFEKYCFDENISRLLQQVFIIDPEDAANSILLESKILEFIFYWREFLCRKDIHQYFNGITDYQLNCIKTATQLLNNNFSDNISIKELSRKSGLNECDLKRCFRKVTGLPVRQYIIKTRMEKARRLLRYTDLPLNEICNNLGYENRTHFIALYTKLFGVHPAGDRLK